MSGDFYFLLKTVSCVSRMSPVGLGWWISEFQESYLPVTASNLNIAGITIMFPHAGVFYMSSGESQVLRLDRQTFVDRAIAQLAIPVLRKPEQTSVVHS